MFHFLEEKNFFPLCQYENSKKSRDKLYTAHCDIEPILNELRLIMINVK
jgi:hypothetical protein